MRLSSISSKLTLKWHICPKMGLFSWTSCPRLFSISPRMFPHISHELWICLFIGFVHICLKIWWAKRKKCWITPIQVLKNPHTSAEGFTSQRLIISDLPIRPSHMIPTQVLKVLTLPKLPSLGLETAQLPDKRRARRCCQNKIFFPQFLKISSGKRWTYLWCCDACDRVALSRVKRDHAS